MNNMNNMNMKMNCQFIDLHMQVKMTSGFRPDPESEANLSAVSIVVVLVV